MGNRSFLAGGRIPSLDGLRAVAILAVSLAHFVKAKNCPLPARFAHARWLGQPGVDLFFVISGFLITHLLIREWHRSGRISLRGFYTRRSLRILPAYGFFLGVTFALTLTGLLALSGKSWATMLTYTVNLFPPAQGWVGHVWSLSVEEHFYFVWPLLFLLLGPRRAIWALFACLLVSPMLRYLIWTQWRDTVIDIDGFTPTRIDTIAIGCLLAFASRTETAGKALDLVKPFASLAIIAASGLLFVALFGVHSGKYTLLIARAVCGGLMATIIVLAADNPDSILGRVLNWKPLVVVGVLSYSLYLWQPLLKPENPDWPLSPWQNVSAMVLMAVGSYLLIEKPFLRLKDRRGVVGGVTPSRTPRETP